MASGSQASKLGQLQREWLRFVFGLELPPARPTATRGADPQNIWRNAKDSVDREIEALRTAFLATGHPLAQSACDSGLGAIASGWLVAFQAALIEEQAHPHALAETARELRDSIAQSELLAILEDNPFRVQVTMRVTLESALEEIIASTA